MNNIRPAKISCLLSDVFLGVLLLIKLDKYVNYERVNMTIIY